MVTFDCPWCAEQAMSENPDTHDLTCEACGIHADLAPDPVRDPVALAA